MGKKAGYGAICSAPLRYMRPTDIILTAPYYQQQQQQQSIVAAGRSPRIEGLVAIRKEIKPLNGRLQVCIVFHHEHFPNKEIYCHERFCRVEEEGPTEHLFGYIPPVVEQEEEQEEQGLDTRMEVPTDIVRNGVVRMYDVELLRSMGYEVDDDNDPAPENVPDVVDHDGDTLMNDQQTWGWSGTCHRKVLIGNDENKSKPRLMERTEMESKSMTILSLFLYFFPLDYLHEVLLDEVNKNLTKEKARRIDLGEFLRFLGLWFYMTTVPAGTRGDFWSEEDISIFSGVPVRFNTFMSEQRFETILNCLQYTNRPAPSYQDKFHGVRQLIDAWNVNMINKFRSSWVSCMDKTTSPWTSKYVCPGWMFVPGQHNNMGNEYHAVCCGVSKIMCQIELVEGKDAPTERVSPTADSGTGKTVSLLLRMLTPMKGRGMVVILNSAYCVLQGLIQLRKIGIFASALIQKRRFWPKHVPGDMMDQHMSTKQVGDVDSLKGQLDDVPYDLFCMKDTAEHTIKLISTYGSLVSSPDAPERIRLVDGEQKRFKYTEPFEDYFLYQDAVHYHSHLRLSNMSLEETWVTDRWEDRVFAFILAITEVNIYLGLRYFVWQCNNKVPMTFFNFKRKLAMALIHNDHMWKEEEEEEEEDDEEEEDITPLHQKKRSRATTRH
ncbi:transposase IS4 [Nitzschia inconspicua]|uniref:Transposase IS4 n=1 Tax=Nitzschia inconspicua TaxID=303405 RepID=A0A9K3PBG8_9STRA|nr:transposase IS4 [Nitzschia inconspicua]